ncbi:MAG: class I SAM-dependent methyltransferase [Gemmatimonadota bacterium]|nr:class I SAM-dependent methyltransferase [Gemmatimonadota bacterium]
MPHATSRNVTRCQISQSANLQSVLFLGFVPPVNDMQPVGAAPVDRPMYPLELLYCPDSHLVQIGCQVDPEVLFPPEYPYTSGTTRILRENFADLFEKCRDRLGVDGASFVIDVGSNDGTLLANFQAGGCRVLGIDPTDRAQLANERGIHSLQAFFSRETARSVVAEYGQARLVTATNVFAHIPDVDEVVAGILDILDESGVFVSESHYLLDLIGTLQYDTVYHEHLRYYSLHSLKFLLEKHGLEIFHVERIPTHGGSIRVFAARRGGYPVEPSVSNQLEEERRAGLLDPETYRRFAADVLQSKRDLLGLLRDVKASAGRIYGIGAPSRASTLIAYTGLDRETIDCVLEIPGSYKIGKYMPGTRIPVLEESALFSDQPEYALLFSWHIAGELIPRLTRKGFRGKYIVPLPSPRIVAD